MLYLNQLDYRHIPYITHTKDDEITDKVYNVAQTTTRDGYPETEVTLITPEVQYEVDE